MQPPAPLVPGPDRPLRIALFTGNYHHVEDGVSRTLNRLVRYLLAQDHEVLIVGPTVEVPPMEHAGTLVAVPSVSIPTRPEYRFTTGFPKEVRWRVAHFRPDVVHIATPDRLGFAALNWAEAEGLPVVSSYHTHFPSYLGYYHAGALEPVLWRIARRFYNRVAEVFVPTPSMAEVLRENGITAPLELWPRGVETDRFRPEARSMEWRRARGFADEDVVVTFVSRLVKEKSIDVYADVVNRLAGEGRRVRGLVVGSGPEREAMEAALPEGVFTGHLGGEEIATAYASSDVFLFPSETETFGNVTLEAMASGLPAVCADAVGSSSLVVDGTTGLLCPPRDTEAFASATARLVGDAALRGRMGTAARERALTYDWDAILGRLAGRYRAVAG
ncbi:MAG: glycosyltransferase family 1 protein [Bacteroidota bacterium]